MEIFHFDRDERRITWHESVGLIATRIAAGEGPVHLTFLKVEPGGTIGTHPAATPQMFLVLTGDGWIAGPGGTRIPITAGQGVCWDEGEDHTSGTEHGFTALAVEGTPLALFAPQAPLG
ncbi:hypothetical protein [Streptacidiphilus anmyonensis]|uniref:hypothetical protein n=1 Tax=Streptacidiphilus anmyonensis TaxID=405782 RepID=UPI0005AADA40|nr:hypothetical protein [Streptacidiphilus anmyonensis]